MGDTKVGEKGEKDRKEKQPDYFITMLKILSAALWYIKGSRAE